MITARLNPNGALPPDRVANTETVLSLDGRIDNRTELSDQMGGKFASDIELIAAAYKRWGNGFVERVEGDFAFVLWDRKRQNLSLGRDRFGIRPLFYSFCDGQLRWASEIGVLLSFPEVSRGIDESFVANYLCSDATVLQSPFQAIRPVPPAHVVVFDGKDCRQFRYWNIDPKRQAFYKADEEYESHFRELFQRSVRARIDGSQTVVAELSGGLDSSSIVTMADHILESEVCSAREVIAVSYLYQNPSGSDEATYIPAIESYRRREHWHLVEQAMPIRVLFTHQLGFAGPSPTFFFIDILTELERRMLSVGSTTLLSGVGGDQVLWGEFYLPYELADLLKTGSFWKLRQRLRRWSQLRSTSASELLWRATIWPALPANLRKRFAPSALPEWVDPKFAARMGIQDRYWSMQEVEQADFNLPSSREQYALLQRLLGGLSAGYVPYRPIPSINVAYPFLDRALVEFLFSIPIEQKLRFDETRSLLRRSLAGMLPSIISSRRDKTGGPDLAFQSAIERDWEGLESIFRNPIVSERGFVDSMCLQTYLRRLKHGMGDESGILTRLLSLELWLRDLACYRPEAMVSSAAAAN